MLQFAPSHSALALQVAYMLQIYFIFYLTSLINPQA